MDSIKALVMECLELYYYYIIKKMSSKGEPGEINKGYMAF